MFFFHGLSSDLIMHAWLINNLLRERRAMFLFKVVRMILYLYFHFSINPKIKLWLFQVTSREEMIIHIYAYIYMHIYVIFVYIYISMQYNYITFFFEPVCCYASQAELELLPQPLDLRILLLQPLHFCDFRCTLPCHTIRNIFKLFFNDSYVASNSPTTKIWILWWTSWQIPLKMVYTNERFSETPDS